MALSSGYTTTQTIIKYSCSVTKQEYERNMRSHKDQTITKLNFRKHILSTL